MGGMKITRTFRQALLSLASFPKEPATLARNTRANLWKDCVAVDVCYHIVCYSDYTKFLTRDTKKQLESERLPSVYAKSYDVFCKKVIKTEIIGHKQIKYKKDLLKKFVTIAKDTENVDVSKYLAFKLQQPLTKSYPQLVFCVPNVKNLDSSE